MRAVVVSPVFVGRQEELASLTVEVTRATSGVPRFVMVGGEAGVGKSRLVEEAARVAAESGARILSGRCVEVGSEGLPLTPIVEALRTLAKSATPEQLDRWLGPARGPLAHLLPSLDPSGGQGASHSSQLPELVLGLIERLSEDLPLMVVIEDLQWADQSTLGLLSYLVRTVQDTPVLMVATYRSDEIDRRHPLRAVLSGWERARQVRRVELGRFGRDEVAAQTAAILGHDADPRTVDLVLDRSEGNPFLVEEIVTVVRDGGDPVDLSPTLRDLLLVRVEARSPHAQRVLRAASVSGRHVPERMLAAVTGMEPAALFEALRELVEHHLLVVNEAVQGYSFRHALTRDAVYHDMLPGERAGWHVTYARALSGNASLATEFAMVPAALAHHWFAALDLPEALPALLAAAATSSAYAPAEELMHLERALEIWPRVSDAERRAGSDLAGVLSSAADAAYRAGFVERALCLLDLALAELDAAGPATRRALLMDRRALVLRDLGRDDEGLADLRAAHDLLPQAPLTQAHAVVLTSLATGMLRGDAEADPATRDRVVARAVEVATQVGAQPQLAEALITLGSVQSSDGDTETGLATMLEGLRLAERIGAVDITVRGHINYSHVLELLGRHQEAIDFAGTGVELARRTGRARTTGAFLAGNMIESMLRLGRWREAEAALLQALRCEPEGVFAVALVDQLAHLTVLTGRTEEGERLAEQVRRQVSASNDLQFVQPVGFTRAEARRQAGDLEAALSIAMTALNHNPELWMGRYAWPLAWLGSRIAADLMILSRDRRMPGTVASVALNQLGALTDRIPVLTPAGRAYAAAVRAERVRAGQTPEAGLWEAAVDSWRTAAEPYMLGYCLFRLAEDQLARGDRRLAGASARQAAAVATELGARPLSGEIGALARRGRLDLTTPGQDEQPPEPAGQDPLAHFGLTEREREVLDLLATGRSNAQIAVTLFISPKTASVHVSNILAKLQVTGRVEAAALVHRLAGGAV
ncbi:AAA family ATPase [Streptosporangiaceae bacterium NEAU-GS5]|nr:AAA family ATPase [Streptosporangiaceae bacterium NEAU-GS5]